MLLPLLSFINTFGLYYNTYRSLIGIYYIPVVMNIRKRIRRTNCFALTLGPYRSNFLDIVKALRLLIALDRSIEVRILGISKVLLIAFTYTFISDIP